MTPTLASVRKRRRWRSRVSGLQGHARNPAPDEQDHERNSPEHQIRSNAFSLPAVHLPRRHRCVCASSSTDRLSGSQFTPHLHARRVQVPGDCTPRGSSEHLRRDRPSGDRSGHEPGPARPNRASSDLQSHSLTRRTSIPLPILLNLNRNAKHTTLKYTLSKRRHVNDARPPEHVQTPPDHEKKDAAGIRFM